MNLHKQLRWGGWWIVIVSLLMNSMNILVYVGYHNTIVQAVYGVGFTGLILACTIIHVAQARQAGIWGLLAYLISVLSLAYANVATFLILAELSGIEEVHQALVGTWDPIIRIAVYSVFIGLTLLGISVAQAGVLPKWAGILVALGILLQFPAQYAMEIAGPLFFLFTIGGSVLFGAGLIWIGWALWSGRGWSGEQPGLSNIDRLWGGPFVIFTALIAIVNAYVNTFGELTPPNGIINLLSTTAVILSIVVLHTAQADRAGRTGLAGFVLTHLGATLSVIPAYLIMAQLAGQIESNRALMASWADIPVGRIGNYMLVLGLFIFGVSVIRSGIFPRWSGWLVVIGISLILPTLFQAQAYFFLIFWAIGATLEGIGLGWMGWTLLRGMRGVTRGQQLSAGL